MTGALSRRSVLRALALTPMAAAVAGHLPGGGPVGVRAAEGSVEVVNQQTTTGGTALWQGFDHRWENHAHRVNRFGSWLQNFSLRTEAQPTIGVGGQYLSRMRYGDTNGGDVADTAAYAAPLLVTDEPDTLTCVHGSATTVLSSVRGERSSLLGDQIAALLPTDMAATVVLRGFDIVCLNAPNDGFHTRGFGFHIRNLAVSQITSPKLQTPFTRLSFQPEFMIWPDRSPDPINIGPTSYEYRLTLYYTAIWTPTDRLHVTPYHYQSSLLVDRDASDPPLRFSRSIDGQGGGVFPQATLGLSGFQFELPEHQGTVHDGRYLRHLSFFVESAGYNAQSGAASFYTNLFFTNKGGWAYDFDIRYTLDTTLIQYVSPVSLAPRRLEQTIDPAVSDLKDQSFNLGGYVAG
jgi:hypothetical protein